MTKIPLGAPAADVVVRLIQLQPSIDSIKLIKYPPITTFNEVMRQTTLAFEQALERRLRHGGKQVEERVLMRAEFSAQQLTRDIENLPPDAALALASEVTRDGGAKAHIPMLDFQCAHSDANLADLRIAMKQLAPAGGVILRSENSYHFYGMSLLSSDGWREFVGRSLLLEPLVDVRWLGHCLLDGFAALRISAKDHNRMQVPCVVANVGCR